MILVYILEIVNIFLDILNIYGTVLSSSLNNRANIIMKTIIIAVLTSLVVSSASADELVSSFYCQPGPKGSHVIKDIKWFEDKLHHLELERKIFNNNDGNLFKFTFSQWTMEFNTPNTPNPKVGLYIGGRAPLNVIGTAGFSLTSCDRGSNTSTTFFNIREIEYNMHGAISVLAIDFIQVEETNGTVDITKLNEYEWAFGSFRLRSTIPISKDPKTATSRLKKRHVKHVIKKIDVVSK